MAYNLQSLQASDTIPGRILIRKLYGNHWLCYDNWSVRQSTEFRAFPCHYWNETSMNAPILSCLTELRLYVDELSYYIVRRESGVSGGGLLEHLLCYIHIWCWVCCKLFLGYIFHGFRTIRMWIEMHHWTDLHLMTSDIGVPHEHNLCLLYHAEL